MPHRIEVFSKIADSRVNQVNQKLDEFSKVRCVAVVDCYTIDKKLSSGELKKSAEALSNPVYQAPFSAKETNISFDWSIEIGFLPGVTDNVATTARETIEDLLKIQFRNGENIYSSKLFLFNGKVAQSAKEKIAALFHNSLIEHAEIRLKDELVNLKNHIVPKVHLKGGSDVLEVDLDKSDAELEDISSRGIRDATGKPRGPLGLSLDYMKAIRDYFIRLDRKPTDIEVETLAQTWSEHCKHTIFASQIDEVKDGLYKHFIKRATNEIRKRKGNQDICVSVFTDNAGGIIFDENWVITDKVETHNSPSALDPFGGAITGIVGVNRDCIGFGKGAKPIINRYGFCFANPESEPGLYRGKNKTNPMLKPLQIMEGVVHGVNVGGNCSGIPTPSGFAYFDERYSGKPLVFVGTVGLIPREINGKPSHEKCALPGDKIVMIGGRVGKDGIHGATFSSVALDEGSPATAVQIGDPITQKKLSDAIIKEARQLELYSAITDNGAGGLSSSVGEMGRDSGGFIIDLEKVPLKYPGLDPWEIWISESQERMTLAVPEKNIEKLFNLLEKRGVEATVIGEFTNSGFAEVRYNNKTIMKISMDFLHDGLPPKILKSKNSEFRVQSLVQTNSSNQTLSSKLQTLLSSLNICSKEFIATQYDHEVQASSVLKPIQGKGRVYAETAICRPVFNSNRGVVLSQGLVPAYSDIDTYHMAAAAIDTAIRNAIAAGGTLDHLALLDNFCWCSSEDAERLYQLKRAAEACYDYATAFGTPFISGKDSMFNDFSGFDAENNRVKISIPPTLLVSSIGVIDDVSKAVSLDAKFAGDIVYVIGETKAELGASEYSKIAAVIENAKVPQVNAEKAIETYNRFSGATANKLISSAIAVTLGGLGIALAKKAIGGKLGMEIDVLRIPSSGNLSIDEILFSESQSRLAVTVAPKNRKAFEDIMAGSIFAEIGVVTSDNIFKIKSDREVVSENKLPELESAYKATLEKY